MAVLVTGASGFVGTVLVQRLLEKGHRVYGLSRHPPAPSENLIPLVGDITQPDLGLEEIPRDIRAIYHLAGIHRLGESKAAEIWETNVLGTENVLRFAEEHQIAHLFFVSSAYTFARNTYEKSKMLCESMVERSAIPRKTIFKPSVIMPTEEQEYPGHFLQFVRLLVKLHKRAEIVRRNIEGGLRLPTLRPLFRVPGNTTGTLNLIKIEDVAKAMAEIESEGVFWLVHNIPPTLQKLVEWVSEVILVDLKIEPQFTATPIEASFQKLGAPFLPYLWGDSFKSDIKAAPIDKKFIQDTVTHSLLKA